MIFQCMFLDDKGLSDRNVSCNEPVDERVNDEESGLNGKGGCL